jgi:2,5-furandicarboxylate decarboxylase 1
MPDLSTFIDTVRRERPREVLDIHRTVSPRYETAAILTKLEQSFRFPIVVFHHVDRSEFPLVSNVCGTQARIALALGCSTRELRGRYAQACEQPIKPECESVGSVQERVFTGKEVNLGALPQLVYHQDDALQPYVTAAIVVARDPQSGKSNLSFHRLMILNENTTTIFMARGKHLDAIYRKYEQAGTPMPIAAFIGTHPACSLGALYTGTTDVEEYDIIGGLLRSPLPVVKCVTNDLRVPAEAEFVLEGLVSPGTRVNEGPFGEFTGYATGTASCPIFTVNALTHRRHAVFQDIVSGLTEHLLLPIAGMEHRLLALARDAAPDTTAVKVAAPLTVFVALKKQNDRQPERIIEALLASDIYVKQVVVVDADVDISDLRQVVTAITFHARPDRDIFVKRRCLGTELDPSCDSPDALITKIGINATLPLDARSVKKNRVPQQLLDSIDLSELLQPLELRSSTTQEFPYEIVRD